MRDRVDERHAFASSHERNKRTEQADERHGELANSSESGDQTALDELAGMTCLHRALRHSCEAMQNEIPDQRQRYACPPRQ